MTCTQCSSFSILALTTRSVSRLATEPTCPASTSLRVGAPTRTMGSQRSRLICQANKGFGKLQGKKKEPVEKILPELRETALSSAETKVLPPLGEGWTLAIGLAELQASTKAAKPVILKSGQAIVLYYISDKVYCSDAYSTAFKFPLGDATVATRGKVPVVEVPLDGTVYSLEDGKVLEWCPKNNPLRFILGSLKEKTEPEPLTVYPTQISNGQIYVLL